MDAVIFLLLLICFLIPVSLEKIRSTSTGVIRGDSLDFLQTELSRLLEDLVSPRTPAFFRSFKRFEDFIRFMFSGSP